MSQFDQNIRELFEKFGAIARVRVSSASTTRYMVEGRGEQGTRNPRTGIGALRRITGRLSRSILGAQSSAGNESIFEINIEGERVVVEIGSNTPYAAVHEFGFNGGVTIPAHQRRIATGTANVRSYVRTMNVPARPYLAPAIESQEEWLADWLGKNATPIIQEAIG